MSGALLTFFPTKCWRKRSSKYPAPAIEHFERTELSLVPWTHRSLRPLELRSDADFNFPMVDARDVALWVDSRSHLHIAVSRQIGIDTAEYAVVNSRARMLTSLRGRAHQSTSTVVSLHPY